MDTELNAPNFVIQRDDSASFKLDANLESLLDPIMPPEIVLMSTNSDLLFFEMDFSSGN